MEHIDSIYKEEAKLFLIILCSLEIVTENELFLKNRARMNIKSSVQTLTVSNYTIHVHSALLTAF